MPSWLFVSCGIVGGCHWEDVTPVDMWAGPRQLEAPNLLPCPWNVHSSHYSHTGNHFKDAPFRVMCCLNLLCPTIPTTQNRVTQWFLGNCIPHYKKQNKISALPEIIQATILIFFFNLYRRISSRYLKTHDQFIVVSFLDADKCECVEGKRWGTVISTRELN